MNERVNEVMNDNCCVCSHASSVIGGIECFNNESLRQLADKALQLHGPNMSVASVGNIGVPIGQLICFS